MEQEYQCRLLFGSVNSSLSFFFYFFTSNLDVLKGSFNKFPLARELDSITLPSLGRNIGVMTAVSL